MNRDLFNLREPYIWGLLPLSTGALCDSGVARCLLRTPAPGRLDVTWVTLSLPSWASVQTSGLPSLYLFVKLLDYFT